MSGGSSQLHPNLVMQTELEELKHRQMQKKQDD